MTATAEIAVYDRVRIGRGKVDWRVVDLRDFGDSRLAVVTTLLGKRRQVVTLDRLTKVTAY